MIQKIAKYSGVVYVISLTRVKPVRLIDVLTGTFLYWALLYWLSTVFVHRKFEENKNECYKYVSQCLFSTSPCRARSIPLEVDVN